MVGLAPLSDVERDDLRRREAAEKRSAWLRRLAIWDGAGPIVLAFLSLSLSLLPGDEAIKNIGMFFIPITAALLRSSAAWKQAVAAEGKNPPSILRQLALSGGIVCLLLFELSFLIAMNIRGGPPPWLWFLSAGAYLLYFLQVAYALRPG